jgi:hypothetical protein
LFELVLDHVGRALDIYVYNAVTDRVSLKTLRPTHGWGGDGCLGLDVGQGYLHALPTESRKTNGVACSLARPGGGGGGGGDSFGAGADNANAQVHIVDPLAPVTVQRVAAAAVAAPTGAWSSQAPQTPPARTPGESKVSRKQQAVAAEAAATSAEAAAAPPIPAAAGAAGEAAAGAAAAVTTTTGPVTPARLPLAAIISPRAEGKRSVGHAVSQ